ncbi:MAG: glycerol-3-phosphate acyltransferase [Actinomycetota bacterium]|nr:glycerol-3-phosphate acyltransferase [Actinomycetota bacterium]
MRFVGYVISIVISYIVGSIPFAYIAGEMISRKDLRKIGSGNLGASNVTKEVGKLAGVVVFFLDCAKMGLVLSVFRILGFPLMVQSLGALAVIVGHNWSIFTKFKGGRGMAVTLTAFLIFLPWESFIVLGIYLYAVLTRTLAMYYGFSLIIWPVMALLRPEPFPWIFFSFGAMVLGFARRLKGSPEVGSENMYVPKKKVIISRLIDDREYRSQCG